MKAILISDHAKWCASMMNGKKKVEVRKGTALYKATQKLIDDYGFAEFYVYCTKGKSLIYTDGTDGKGDYVDYKYYESYKGDKNDIGSGKVLFKFRCYKVEEINKYPSYYKINGFYYTPNLSWDKLEKVSCLSFDEINEYLKGKTSTAIHISDLEIFDKPKELSEFYGTKQCFVGCENGIDKTPRYARLTKAPQSFMFIESEK